VWVIGLTLVRLSDDIRLLIMPKNSVARKKLSPQARRDLDVEIGFIEGVVKRDPQFAEALQVLGDDYTRRGRYVDGLKIDEQLIRMRPDDPVAHYNLACSYSLTEQYDQAVAALDRALSLGYRDFQWLARDPDLQKLRKHPLYRHIRDKVKSLTIKSR
jgi:tetratricopeptide (TPR) repeat protein